MSSIGTSIAQAVAGLNQTERVASRDTDRPRRPAGTARRDTVELDVEAVTETGSERDLKGNEQEDAHQDHLARENRDDTPTPHLDLEG